ncbi:hypothetical protein UFOVP1444_24 [uncultured Caudovirales phage]|uniref:Uncharacterized protein n=1 Tax=uncultured Caudovirales phage TaxID=2100421 RepID=A0A6J5SEM6_9CAUD|nr:hypothetical protein UFOVP1444_24 [uncultured Caudovirales phage]CAB5227921.1 hypothetical protein UFOVP1536_12 [uncultured Caudovirales phage]
MKNILIGLFALAAVTVGAQEYKSRQPYPDEIGRVSGVNNYIQDEFQRLNTIVVLETNQAAVYTIGASQVLHGIYAVAPTNAALSAAFTISLPNPTNNPNRKFTFITADHAQIVLSNNWGTGSANGFRDLKTFGVSNIVWLVTSNKITTLYSTGTNYLVKSI